jgi:hypothetical protein
LSVALAALPSLRFFVFFLWLALLLLSFVSLIVLIRKGFFGCLCAPPGFLVEEILILYCFIFISRGA